MIKRSKFEDVKLGVEGRTALKGEGRTVTQGEGEVNGQSQDDDQDEGKSTSKTSPVSKKPHT